MGTGAGADGLHDWRSMRSTAGDPSGRCVTQLSARRTASGTRPTIDAQLNSRHVAQRSGARPASDCRPAARALAVLLSAGRSLPSYGIKTCNYLRFKPKNVKTCMLFLAPAAFCWLALRRAPPQLFAWTCRASDGSKAHLGRPGPAGQSRPSRTELLLHFGRLEDTSFAEWAARGLKEGLSVRSAAQVPRERPFCNTSLPGARSPKPKARSPRPKARSPERKVRSPEPGAWGSPDNGAGPVGHRRVECWGGGMRLARRREARRAAARDTTSGGSGPAG